MATELLRVTAGEAAGTEIPLDGEFVIGRSAEGEGTLGGDEELSRQHARITRGAAGELLIEDLGSTNGTYVNGHAIAAPTPIRPGDRIEVGRTKIEVVGAPVASGDTVTAPVPGAAQVTQARPVPTPAAPAAQAPAAPPPQAPAPQAPGAPQPIAPQRGLSSGVLRFAKQPEAFQPQNAPSQDDPAGRHPVIIAIATVIAGILIGGMISAAIFSDDDEAAGSTGAGAEPGQFAAYAQGFSVDTLDAERQRELDITATFLNAPHGITELTVNKFLDESTPPPNRVYDATYTLTAENGDTVTLEATGQALPPGPPDGFFGRADEDYTVVEGTGIFEGATGEGKILSTVVVANRMGPDGEPNGSDLSKFFRGTLQLDE